MTQQKNWYTERKQQWQIAMERKHAGGSVIDIKSSVLTGEVFTTDLDGRKKQRQAELLAAAIIELLEWQSRQLELKEERKIRAMLTRQRNRLLNRKQGLSD